MPEKIGFVGVGRMGSNMARRLKESSFEVSAVYDLNNETALALAQELGAVAAEQPRTVTRLSDVIITVVSDDKAMKQIYNGGLLSRAKGKLFINCATVTPDVHVWVEAKAEKAGAQSLEACMASSITQARAGHALSHVRRQAGSVRARQTDSGKAEPQRALRRPGRQSRAGEGAGEHGHEHQHRRAGRRPGGGGRARARSQHCCAKFSPRPAPIRACLQTDGEDMQNRDHACFFSAAHAAKDSGIALKLGKAQGLTLPLAAATKKTIRPHGSGRPGRTRQIGHRRTDFQEPPPAEGGGAA